ncbi:MULTISPECIES: TetR/AcrR family transcriptional regulator [unclassified Streptomyces]|uniref:TetR/AcrR family transcriptional regulator n=1 Tax=unclassified Streptomyces TaxID=2593676 RepID=UPI002476D32F|nr:MULTISPECIES: TetR/AcrR family transcriptional regulator [unclassified Streptomyces]MDH6455302.1 AcrR family transcriptional regulator [Streptomyces sp. SAI-119]MDH6494145.1 AcrR family transcriptional regulator [Streptomyces sp. SAI-149]
MVRSDARENRARILAAAREAFAEDGGVSMNQVAQRAGVGAGTLYRNFPTREALVLAVYQDEVVRIIGTVPDLLAELPPLEALRQWTIDLVEAMRRKHGLGDALSPGAHQAISEQSYGPVVAAITELLDAGKKDGSIREDADPGDFLQLTGALWRAATTPEDRAPRMLALVLDGLRTHR